MNRAPVSARGADLPATGSTVNLPDAGGVLTALARIGYSLEVALADLVDNSVDAKASEVLIRFYRTNRKLVSLAVVDNGTGMTAKRMDEAMGFGRDTGKQAEELGKYGMGLKSASFSQCRAVTVLSKRNRTVTGRRWTADNIKRGWLCEHIARPAAEKHLGQDWGELSLDGSGTLVHWDELDAFRVASNRADGVLEKLIRRISVHLGLHFHRFMESGQLRVFIDAVNEQTGEAGPPRPIEPLNPFGYPNTGRRGFPRTFSCEIPGVGPLNLEGHIWPKRLRTPEYTLGGGKVAQRQGFYFYRNDRLIQAGGWNGWRDEEPHTSIARVRVDLPSAYDHAFGLNVQKSAVSVPAGFIESVARAESGSMSLSDYVRKAGETYRKPAASGGVEAPLVPGQGVGSRLTAKAKKHIVGNQNARARKARFEWRRLDPDVFFDMDVDRDIIYLNSKFRDAVLMGTRRTAADAPLVKSLLFLLLVDELDRERISSVRRDRLAGWQGLLVSAAELQQRKVNRR